MGFRTLAALALTCLTTVNSQYPFWRANVGCEMCLDGVCYGITKLSKDHAKALTIGETLAIDRVENILYCNYGLDIKALNLNDKVMRMIIPNEIYRTGIAVDQATRDLYFIKDKDIGKYNPVTNQTDYIHTDQNFMHLYFKDKLYAGSGTKVYVLKDSKLELFGPLKDIYTSHNIMIDKRGDFYFRQGSAIHKLPAGGNASALFDDRKNIVYTTDKDGIAYFIDRKTIFRLDYTTNKLVEVGVFDVQTDDPSSDLKSVDFDKYNNVIYVNNYLHVYYLTANAGRCKVKKPENMVNEDKSAVEKL